ncbi:GNAT family N-acetyltransferase, partial [Xanthomonas sp. Kuri4-1]
MRIVHLAEVPEHVPALARAHVAAFGALLPDWSVAEAEAELRTHLREAASDATWVALEGEQWLGSVSLLDNDHAEITQYSPWLASLYVCPGRRGSGLGARLVAHCVA